LNAPHRWRLICFDDPWPIDYDSDPTEEVSKEAAAAEQPYDIVAESIKRDASMAKRLTDERSRLAADAKVLLICGNFHARTSNHGKPGGNSQIPADSPEAKIWPSLAGALAAGEPALRVKSVNIVPNSGGYYAMVSIGD